MILYVDSQMGLSFPHPVRRVFHMTASNPQSFPHGFPHAPRTYPSGVSGSTVAFPLHFPCRLDRSRILGRHPVLPLPQKPRLQTTRPFGNLRRGGFNAPRFSHIRISRRATGTGGRRRMTHSKVYTQIPMRILSVDIVGHRMGRFAKRAVRIPKGGFWCRSPPPSAPQPVPIPISPLLRTSMLSSPSPSALNSAIIAASVAFRRGWF